MFASLSSSIVGRSSFFLRIVKRFYSRKKKKIEQVSSIRKDTRRWLILHFTDQSS